MFLFPSFWRVCPCINAVTPSVTSCYSSLYASFTATLSLHCGSALLYISVFGTSSEPFYVCMMWFLGFRSFHSVSRTLTFSCLEIVKKEDWDQTGYKSGNSKFRKSVALMAGIWTGTCEAPRALGIDTGRHQALRAISMHKIAD